MVSRRRASSSSSVSTAKAAVIGLFQKLATTDKIRCRQLTCILVYLVSTSCRFAQCAGRGPVNEHAQGKRSGGMDAALSFRVEYDGRRRDCPLGVGDGRSGRGRDQDRSRARRPAPLFCCVGGTRGGREEGFAARRGRLSGSAKMGAQRTECAARKPVESGL